MKRHFQILLSGALAIAALQTSHAAVNLTTGGTWFRLSWASDGTPGATNSGVDASNRVLAWDRNDTFRVNDDNDVFNFSVASGFNGVVDVVDIEANDDRYSVLDFNNSLTNLGSTSAPIGNNPASVQDDPNVTILGNWSSGSINITPVGGVASFKLERDQGSVINVGGVFVRARQEVIPEPSSSILMMLGLAGLIARRRRA